MTKTYRTKVNASLYLTVVQNLLKSSSIESLSRMSVADDVLDGFLS